MVTLTVNIAGSRCRFAAGDARRWIWKLYTAFWTLDFMIKMWAPNERQEDRVREPRWYYDWNTDFTTSESLRSKLAKGVCLLHNSLVYGLCIKIFSQVEVCAGIGSSFHLLVCSALLLALQGVAATVVSKPRQREYISLLYGPVLPSSQPWLCSEPENRLMRTRQPREIRCCPREMLRVSRRGSRRQTCLEGDIFASA